MGPQISQWYLDHHKRILKLSKSFASSFTKEVGPKYKIKSICPSSCVCWGMQGEMWNKCVSCSVVQRQYLNANVQESFRTGYNWCICPAISPLYCFSRQQTLVQGTTAARIGTKIHLFLSLFVKAYDINQQPWFLFPSHPVITETKALAAPSSATFPVCPSVAVKVSDSS